MQRCLQRMEGLHDYFDAIVCAEDEADTLSQRLLTASIKLHRWVVRGRMPCDRLLAGDTAYIRTVYTYVRHVRTVYIYIRYA